MPVEVRESCRVIQLQLPVREVVLIIWELEMQSSQLRYRSDQVIPLPPLALLPTASHCEAHPTSMGVILNSRHQIKKNPLTTFKNVL